MMEGNFMSIFTVVGIASLYLVIATLVGMGVYAVTKKLNNGDRVAAAIIGGALFPFSVPIIIIIFWIWSIVTIPTRMSENRYTDMEECSQEVIDVRGRVDALESAQEVIDTIVDEEMPKPKPKFKAGDLITGVSGNPAGYKHLYEGSICRVLEVNDGKAMRVLLVDHVDAFAHREEIGEEFRAPQRYFKLYKLVTKKKPAASKKKPTKKVAKKKK